MEFSKNDKTSYSNTEDFLIKKTHFNWKLDFNAKKVFGSVTHNITIINSNSEHLILDVSSLDIQKISVNKENVPFHYINGKLGGKLVIPMKCGKHDQEFQVNIEYSTTEKCTALLWMSPEMTFGRSHPFLYSQSEAIHGRSLFPCQDSPSVKACYTADIEAPKDLEVVMSAVKKTTKVVGGIKQHHFEQKIPVSSYLVSIACGNIVGCKIGPRSTVWCEPQLMEKAKWEFEEIERIIVIAEELCGPYEWEVCDLLILPPTFPYGGMENPCMIFLSPCLLTGDRSQINYISHEIAHSWTGNLVTNSTWDHFWINEGHTNYLERLILEQLQSSEPYRHLHISVGIAELEEALDNFPSLDHEYTKLVPHLEGVDPDDSFSRVPYEKGSFFLFYLENLIGKDKMLRWLKKYIATFRLKSLSTEEWKHFFMLHMCDLENVNKGLLEEVDWDTWFYKPGRLPIDHHKLLDDSLLVLDNSLLVLDDSLLVIDNSLLVQCKDLAKLWIDFEQSLSNENDLLNKFLQLLPDQKHYFFQILNDINKKEVKLAESSLKLMGHLYGLTSTSNSELLYGWSILCLRACYEPAIDQIFKFVNSQGRLKYNKAIYRHLIDWSVTRMRTQHNFIAQMSFMHPVTRGEIQKIVFPD